MDHIVLNVDDVDAMLDFYGKTLGLATERVELYRDGRAPFPSVRVSDDSIIDLFPPGMWEGGRGADGGRRLNHFCLAVEGAAWQEFLGRLEEHGVEIEEGPVRRWGAHGAGISVYFRDPEGNTVEVRHYPADINAAVEKLES
jgi:catechol 2,3-dioxygenase-like lactoylglutathione lyase family enzyme